MFLFCSNKCHHLTDNVGAPLVPADTHGSRAGQRVPPPAKRARVLVSEMVEDAVPTWANWERYALAKFRFLGGAAISGAGPTSQRYQRQVADLTEMVNEGLAEARTALDDTQVKKWEAELTLSASQTPFVEYI